LLSEINVLSKTKSRTAPGRSQFSGNQTLVFR